MKLSPFTFHLSTLTCLLLLFAFHVSAQQMFMQVEVRQPAEVKIQSNIRNILLVNNTPLTDDSPLRCLFAAAGMFEELERFDNVSVLPSLTTSTSVDSLCERYEVDALLTLNALVISDDFANAYWTVYMPHGRASSFFTETEFEGEDGPAIVGSDMAKLLSPSWETEDRYLYRNDDPAILAGLEAVTLRDWNKAIAEWSQASGTAESQAYAAANTAVAYEMQDRFEDAIAWTKRAINAFRRLRSADAAQQVINLRYYQSQLEDRSTNKL